MTSLEEHRKKIKEHFEEIEEAIDRGIEKRPITIGFHCSACSVELLEVYLHLINKIPVGKILKHDWFEKPKPEQKIEPLIDRKLSLDFPEKEEIYNLIYSIEDERNSLLYGKPSEKQVKEVLESFQKLKTIFMELYENEKFKL